MAKYSHAQAEYEGPEDGPFRCGNCKHFDGQNRCEIVTGKVEADGCCRYFDTANLSRVVEGLQKTYAR